MKYEKEIRKSSREKGTVLFIGKADGAQESGGKIKRTVLYSDVVIFHENGFVQHLMEDSGVYGGKRSSKPTRVRLV